MSKNETNNVQTHKNRSFLFKVTVSFIWVPAVIPSRRGHVRLHLLFSLFFCY